MPKGYIDGPANKTEEELKEERWLCYLNLRKLHPKTFGAVNLKKLKLEKLTREITQVMKASNPPKPFLSRFYIFDRTKPLNKRKFRARLYIAFYTLALAAWLFYKLCPAS